MDASLCGPATTNESRVLSATLRVYSHVTPTMQREAAQVMDAVLGGSA